MNGIIDIARCGMAVLLLLLTSPAAQAQQTAGMARQYAIEKKYDKAIEIYEELYGISPDSVYHEYLNTLLTAQKYKQAEKLVEKKAALYPKNSRNPEMNLELGQVYEKSGKAEKAKVQYDSILNMLNGDDLFTTGIAKAFTDAGRPDYAILTYERALQLLGNPPMYGRQLATLYAGAGNYEKAIAAMLRGGPSVFMTADGAKELLLELLGNDPKKLQLVQKALVKKINEEPGNNYYAEILTWIYTQKDDWDGALIQMEAIDERNQESGKRLMDFARTAVAARQYEVANKAYDGIIAKGKEQPYYVLAKSEKLGAALAQLEKNNARTPEDITALAALYDSFLTEFPKHYTQKTAADYATLHAVYGNNVKKAIEILKRSIAEPDTRRNMMGQFKLQLGDYYLLQGRQWDASLSYSQVEKDFKQDVMGEDARFRNARLAYYHGDFDLAQKLLGILKSGTSNLIANDAIDLSVLITENVEDSNTAPLQRFAYAGLLLFQNKDKEAEQLIDSIANAAPKHPLMDDLVMMHARIAIKHRDFTRALGYLKEVADKYGKDVLGDDAVYKIAEIYDNELDQKSEAKKYYEQLIIDYPGSTFVQAARQRLGEINKQGIQ
ncbi:MAG: tetratricopeptide repeat protein [Taibaiella sp.]|nr:tetratricopeptide repeat protein [Taibaiella sp.]